MAQEKRKIEVELHLSSETKRDLLELLGSSKMIIMRSTDRADNRLLLEL